MENKFNLHDSITIADTRKKFIFWDIDGTLAPYRFNGHVGDPNGTNNGQSIEEIEVGIFLERNPSKHMQKVLAECEAEENIVMGHCQNDKEKSDKYLWLDIHYPMIKERNLTSENIPKYQTILNYCDSHNIGLQDVIYVDDVIPFLREAEKHGIKSYHISSFLDWEYQERCSYKLGYDIPEEILNMKLTDCLCKHVFSTDGSQGANERSWKLLMASIDVGYKYCLWNTFAGHIKDFDYDMGRILKMEDDGYEHALRIVKCKYDFSDSMYYWCDNIHSSIMYLRKHGLDVRLRDLPFYVVDITDITPQVLSYNNSVRNCEDDVKGAIQSAYQRKEWSNSREIVDIGYTIGDFIKENYEFYTFKNSSII